MLAFPYGVVLNDQASVNTKHKAPDDISRRFHTHGYFSGQVTGSQFEQIITGIYSLLSFHDPTVFACLPEIFSND